jgi:hypothetical protein
MLKKKKRNNMIDNLNLKEQGKIVFKQNSIGRLIINK